MLFASLVSLLLRSDFRFEYVASYSNRELPFFYKLAALWAGNDGSQRSSLARCPPTRGVSRRGWEEGRDAAGGMR